MKKATIKEIQKSVEKSGGQFKKERATLNGQAAYTVNGRMITKPALIEEYLRGEL